MLNRRIAIGLFEFRTQMQALPKVEPVIAQQAPIALLLYNRSSKRFADVVRTFVVIRFIGSMILAPMNGGTTSGVMTDQNVLRFQIAMDDARIVGVMQGFGDRCHVRLRGPRRCWDAAPA